MAGRDASYQQEITALDVHADNSGCVAIHVRFAKKRDALENRPSEAQLLADSVHIVSEILVHLLESREREPLACNR